MCKWKLSAFVQIGERKGRKQLEKHAVYLNTKAKNLPTIFIFSSFKDILFIYSLDFH